MASDSFQYILCIVSTLLIGLLLFLLIRVKNKAQMHYIFISLITLLIIWNLGSILDKWWSDTFDYTNMVFVDITFIGTCLIPVAFLLTGIVFAKTKIRLNYRHLSILIIPVISTLILWTNGYHHLFFIKYSFISNNVVFGKYFSIHAAYSYICILLGMYFLVYFSIKNAGFFSRQSILILVGSIIPLIINIIFTLKIYTVTQFATPITFSFAIVCYFIAIVKYDFLRVVPIAMQTVVDRISDGFMVIDLYYRIVNYNKTLIDTFNNIAEFKRKGNILKVLEGFKSINMKTLKSYIEKTAETKKSLVFDHHFQEKDFDKYFNIEITPIISSSSYLGTIILLKDITEHKENLKTIKGQQEKIIDQERLASLGTLMGGISHNLKTPIMSISGCIIVLEDLTNEYRESIGNPIVNECDHLEMANEMLSNLNDLKGHFSYISNALTAIKNQVANPDSRMQIGFTPEEVVLNIEFLMKYEIKANLCTLNINNQAGKDHLISGEIGTLVQIINNLISNAIQSYERITDENYENRSLRQIDLFIYEIENYIIFKVEDHGRGISKEIKDKLFKEMVTTKGKEGSGIGLYLSYSKIKVMFNGDLWFESEEGKGTSFYLKVQRFQV